MSSTQLFLNPMTGQFDLVTKPSASVEDLSDRMDTLEAKYVRTTRFAEVESGTSGQATVAFGSTIVLDDFSGGVDALVTEMENGVPKYTNAYTAQGELITTEFDSLGNYTLSGTPAAYPVAVVYRVRTPLVDFDDTDPDIVGDTDLEEVKWVRRNITAANSPFSPESVNGVAYAVDLSGGSVVINLPEVTTSNEGHECIIYLEREAAGNYLDVICFGTQTIRGATSQRLTTVRDGFTLIAHTYLSNHWDSLDWAKPIKGDTRMEGLTIEGPIQSDSIAAVLQEIAHSMAASGRSGLLEWAGSGAYWSWTPGNPGTFTLLRGGEGYVAHKRVDFLGGQTLSFAYGEVAVVYIDDAGVLQKDTTNTREEILTRIQIGLFQNDINGAEFFLRKDHRFFIDTGSQAWIQSSFGAALESVAGTGVISRYTTGTGAAATDRMVNLSAGKLIDADIETSWAAFTTGTTTNHTYFNGTNFVRYSASKEYPPVYNNAGVAATAGVGDRVVFRLFVTVDSMNSADPQFISEMHTAVFGTLGQAQTAIGNGSISNLGGLNKDLAQLGFVVVRNSVSGGYVEYVEPQRKTFAQVIGGGGVASTASNVLTDTANFDRALGPTHTTVQAALEALDDAVPKERTVTTSQTLLATDSLVMVDVLSGSVTVTLPLGSSVYAGKTITICNSGQTKSANSVYVYPQSGYNIDGFGTTTATAINLKYGGSVTLVYTAADSWKIVGREQIGARYVTATGVQFPGDTLVHLLPASGALTFTIYADVGAGKRLFLSRDHNNYLTNVCTITEGGGGSIGGIKSFKMNPGESVVLVSDGYNWRVESTLTTFDIQAAIAKASPADADRFKYQDTESNNRAVALTFAELKAALKAYFDTLYTPL